MNLEDVTLSGNHYVAAVIAHTYGDVIDCSVDGFEIVVTTNNVAAEGEEPEYMVDENGNLILDENGNPIPVVPAEEEIVEEAEEEIEE